MSETYPDDIPPGVEEAMYREIAVLDFRRAAFIRLMRLRPCIDCGCQGTWWDSDPPEVFYCSCPAGERALRRKQEDCDYREGMLVRWTAKRVEEAARPRRTWVKTPAPGEPGGALQATLRRLQRLGVSAGWVDLFAAGWRSPDVLEAILARPWDGPAEEKIPGRPRATPRSDRPAYGIARARWIVGEGARAAFHGELASADTWAMTANRWLDLFAANQRSTHT